MVTFTFCEHLWRLFWRIHRVFGAGNYYPGRPNFREKRGADSSLFSVEFGNYFLSRRNGKNAPFPCHNGELQPPQPSLCPTIFDWELPLHPPYESCGILTFSEIHYENQARSYTSRKAVLAGLETTQAKQKCGRFVDISLNRKFPAESWKAAEAHYVPTQVEAARTADFLGTENPDFAPITIRFLLQLRRNPLASARFQK